MQLLQCLFLVTAHFEFILKAAHIPGKQNKGADAISQNNTSVFLSQVLEATPQLAKIPQALEMLLIYQQPD